MHLDPDLVSWRARHDAAREAVYWDGRWLTYADLARRAERTAAQLAALGLGPRDRVGLLAENHLAHLDLLFAGARMGTVLVPYNHRLAAAELRALVEYTEPKALFVQPDLAHLVDGVAPRVLDVEETAAATPTRSQVFAKPALDDHALLLFTGGTTGMSKAACITHRQLVVNATSTTFSWGLRPDDRYICSTPMFHAAVNALATPLLYLGGQVLLQRRFDPAEYLAWVSEHRATLLFLVPTMYQMLADHPDFDRADLAGVRWAISGGAPCPEPVRRRFGARGVLFRQGYGLTECGVNCFAMTPEEAETAPESVGRPILNLEARLSGDDAGTPAGAGGVGELWLSGPVVMDGYFRRPEATAEALVEAGGRRWLRTGDLARVDDAGRYYIVGRKKEMFISGGENVYPAEIEKALYEHPAVAECAVVGVPSARWGEVGLAAVVKAPGAEVDADALRAFVGDRLARYKVPKHWVFVDALPKSGPGKILRREVAERWAPKDA